MSDTLLLSSLWVLPVIGLIVVLAVPKRNEASIKWISLGFMLATFLVTLVLLRNYLAEGSKSWKPLAERAKNNTLAASTDGEGVTRRGDRGGRE